MPEITIELNKGRSVHETQFVNKSVRGVLFADHFPAA
jgi:hypothetical protein